MFWKTICLTALAAVMMVLGAGNAQESRTNQNISQVADTKVAAQAASLHSLSKYFGATQDAMHATCIEKGQTCTLHGTPCCNPYNCKGSFPNTTCK